MLELDAEIDARWQVKGVTATAWNATDQELVSADASEPSVTDSGNLSASELSDVIGGDPHLLRHGGKLSEPSCRRGPTGGCSRTGSPRSAAGCASRGSAASPPATSSR